MIVGAGGFVGSALRFVVSGSVQRLVGSGGFPYGTLTVNVIGCFLIGAVATLAFRERMLFSSSVRNFLMVGLLGSFTTFSTFGYETMALIRDGEMLRGLANVAASVLVGLLSVALGMMAVRVLPI